MTDKLFYFFAQLGCLRFHCKKLIRKGMIKLGNNTLFSIPNLTDAGETDILRRIRETGFQAFPRFGSAEKRKASKMMTFWAKSPFFGFFRSFGKTMIKFFEKQSRFPNIAA